MQAVGGSAGAAGGLPRVSILMTGAGGGHLASAQSLTEAFDDRAHVTVVNLLDEHAPFPFNRLSRSYAPIVAIAPNLYGLAYKVVQTPVGGRLLDAGAYELLGDDLATAILETEPDLVISVHALLNAIPLRAIREAGCAAPFVSAVVDGGVPPVSWFTTRADLCCVADEGIRGLALEAGMPSERVVVTGLPIRRSFAEARGLAEEEARRILGVEPDLPLVLVMGGGEGMGRLGSMTSALAKRLAGSGVRAQMAVITGGNERLRGRLAESEWPIPVTVLGLTSDVARWMAAADVLLTKAGPGTVAEAACLGVPTLLTGFVPGQEEGNVAWAERHGGAVYEPRPRHAAALVERWLSLGNGELAMMGERMRTMARCDAARDIADAALRLLA